MATLMQRMLENFDYAKMTGTENYDLSKFIANDYDTPLNVYKISIPNNQEIIDSLITNNQENQNSPYLDLTDELKKQIEYSLNVEDIIFHLNTYSIYSFSTNWNDLINKDKIIRQAYTGRNYYNGKINKEIAYLYTFETGQPIFVFFKNLNNKILATSFFIPNENFSTLSGTRKVFKVLNCSVELYKSK